MPKETMTVGDYEVVVGWTQQDVQIGVIKAGTENHEPENGLFGSLTANEVELLIKTLRRAKRKAYV